jgi:hypothetical protein
LVSDLLQETIACYVLRVLRPVSLIVIPVLFPPALVAFLLVLAVVRVGLHLLALPALPTQTPALLSAAIAVVLYAGVGGKRSSAVGIGAPDLLAHGFCLQDKTMTLFRGPILGKNKNQIRRRWVISLQGQRKNIQGWGFLDRPTIGTSSPAKTRDFLTGGNKKGWSFLKRAWNCWYDPRKRNVMDGTAPQPHATG